MHSGWCRFLDTDLAVVNRCVKCVQETFQGRVRFLSKGRCIKCFFFFAVVGVVRLPLIKLEITIYSPHFDEKLKWNTLQLKLSMFSTFFCRFLYHALWRTLTSDDEYFFLFLNLSAVSKKSERNSPTFSAKWNKRDKVWKTRIHYKVTFSLPWPSSSLKLLSFVRFLNSRDPFIRSTPPFHRPGRDRLRWSVILTFPSVDEILWCCFGRRSVWFCWNVWSFLKFLPIQSNSNFLSLSVIRWTPLWANIIYGWPQWYPC